MTDSLKLAKKALETRLRSIANALPTAWENVAFTPPADGAAFQRCNVMPAPPENPTLGDGFYRERGLMQVTLSYPFNTGSGAAYARAEAIRAWFPRGSSLSTDGIVVQLDRTPTIGPAKVVEDRFLLPVTVQYRVDVFA